MWENGKQHGEGTVMGADGTSKNVTYDNGKRLSTLSPTKNENGPQAE